MHCVPASVRRMKSGRFPGESTDPPSRAAHTEPHAHTSTPQTRTSDPRVPAMHLCTKPCRLCALCYRCTAWAHNRFVRFRNKWRFAADGSGAAALSFTSRPPTTRGHDHLGPGNRSPAEHADVGQHTFRRNPYDLNPAGDSTTSGISPPDPEPIASPGHNGGEFGFVGNCNKHGALRASLITQKRAGTRPLFRESRPISVPHSPDSPYRYFVAQPNKLIWP